MVAAKLPLVPRYRQKVRFVPLRIGRPLWVDDPHFNLGYHLRHTALPAPGGDRELRNLVGRVMSQQLDRHKPLWEMWMVEGLGEGHWALVSKVHHCMVDGVSGTDLLTVVLDREPAPARRRPSVAPGARAGQRRAARARAARRARQPVRAAPHRAECRPGAAAVRRRARSTRHRALAAMRGAGPTHAAHSRSTAPIGPHRRWDWARTTLSDVKTVRAALGGTVNDVVLTVITSGFRDLLLSRGETSTIASCARSCRCRCARPASAAPTTTACRRCSPSCPSGSSIPVERLGVDPAADGRPQGVEAGGRGRGAHVAVGVRAVDAARARRARGRAIPQRNVNTVTTNVPGPQ